MNLTSDAIDKIAELVRAGDKGVPVEYYGQQYLAIGGDLKRIDPPHVQTLCVASLQSVVGYIQADLDKATGGGMIVVVGDNQVEVYSPVHGADRKRDRWLVATPVHAEAQHRFGSSLDLKEFLVYISTCFERTEEQQGLVDILSHVGTRETADLRDNGFSQEVTTTSGVATRTRKTIPVPVLLRPYITFPEIAQPEREFIVRLDGEGQRITARLIPSGSATWKLQIREDVAAWLEGILKGVVPIIW